MNEAQASLVESSQKIDLIRAALDRLEATAERASLASTAPNTGSGGMEGSSEPQSPTSAASVASGSSFSLAGSAGLALPKAAAVTGQLQVRLMGCQNLLVDVPGKNNDPLYYLLIIYLYISALIFAKSGRYDMIERERLLKCKLKGGKKFSVTNSETIITC